MLKVLKFLHISTKGINFALPKGAEVWRAVLDEAQKKIALCLSHRAIPLKTKIGYIVFYYVLQRCGFSSLIYFSHSLTET